MNKKKRMAWLLLLAVSMLLPAAAKKTGDGLPLDSAVRIGRLKNGFTYYIRHNEKPEKKADFYIAQKVGSIQEEEHQRGLAHFLEHMCFNGTEHFPGDGLKRYLENIGVKFGENLNAYTSIDETVYNINNVPMDVNGSLDSCLWILRDWADGLTLDPVEIDKERGVIHEEWRGSMNANSRMTEQVLPKVFPGSRYGERLPIGLMSVVDSFPYQALRDYYEKWYRPDLQAIVIVGDVDVDAVEKKVKKIFSKIKKAKKPAERVYFPVDDNDEMIFAQATDKEAQNYSLQLLFKYDVPSREECNTAENLYIGMVRRIATTILNRRFGEMLTKENPPFMSAGVGYGNYIFASTKGAFSIMINCKPEQIVEAVPTVLTEVERARRYGFTRTEFEREIKSYRNYTESWYAERDKRSNNFYVDACVRHFLDNAPMMSPQYDYELINAFLDSISIEEVNAVIPTLMTEKNRVAVSYAPEKEGVSYPDKNDLEMLMKYVAQAQITPYVDVANDAPLLAEIPAGGKIVSREDGVWGSTVWRLSNGITVVIKATDFSADHISLSGYSKGGLNHYQSLDDRLNVAYLNSVVPLGGYGAFDAMQLGKKLTGKTATSRVWVTDIYERAEAGCNAKDMETMFKLLYLQFTAPRMDMQAYEGFLTRSRNMLKDRDLNPNTALSDTLGKALYNDNPRCRPILADEIDSIDYGRIMEIYRERVCDAGDFTFVIVGNVDTCALAPLVETYLGGLPATGRNEDFTDDGIEMRKGAYSNNFARKMETPTGTEILIYNGEIEGTQKNKLLMGFLSQILNIVYTTEVREKEGGTYGVSVGGSIAKYPKGEYNLTISFNMAPERREELKGIVLRELEKMAKEGPVAEHVEKVRSYMLKSFDEAQKDNGSWSHWLYRYYFDNEDVYSGYVELVNSLTSEDIRRLLATILDDNNLVEVSMVPEK